MVVSVVEKTIQDAERIIQLVDLQHLYSLVDACRDLDPCVDQPALLVAVFIRALADSGSFPSLRLFDPRSGPAEGSSSLSASSSRHLFRVTVSLDDDAFEDIEYIEASLYDPEIVSLEDENDVYQEEEEVDLEDIFQIQDVVLRKKLLSINRLIADIKSLNDNPTPDYVLKSSAIFEEFDNSLSDNSSLEFKTFIDQTEETRSGSTTTHDSLPEYDSFCFKIEPNQERLINIVKNDISDDSTNDLLLEEVDLFLASDNSIPPDVKFFFDLKPDVIAEEISNELNEDNCIASGEEIDVFTNDEDADYFPFMFVIRIFLPYLIYPKVFPLLLSAESEDTIFDPGIFV
nr:hypothetical protein [Tanacetum cinerariifolium]